MNNFRFAIYIASRYLFSKKKHHAVNIISTISAVSVAIGTIALIVVLSAFNGLEGLVESLYSSFDPAIKIMAKEGKTFNAKDIDETAIKAINGVKYCTQTLEETVYLEYRKNESLASVKGIEPEFIKMTGLDSMIVEGELKLKEEELNYAILGYGIAYNLSVFIETLTSPIKIYAAKRDKNITGINAHEAFNKELIMPSSVFSVNQDFDMKYILVPLDFAKKLLGHTDEVSALEVDIEKNAEPEIIKQKVQAIVGNAYEVKTRYEINELIFKTNAIEKWITYLILSFILLIATFNVISSLTMLIMDKKEDIYTLQSMGANNQLISQIFFLEGLLITLLGGVTGLVIGALICWGQQLFGFVRLGGIIVDYYPVSMKLTDFILILSTVFVIGIIASWLPVKFVGRRYLT